MSDKIKELEKEYKEIEDTLPEDNPTEEVENSISSVNCSECGTRLTTTEWREFEDVCEDCVHADTAGLIDDDDYKELDFDETY